MKIKNKLIVGLGTIATIAIPTITVVACGTVTNPNVSTEIASIAGLRGLAGISDSTNLTPSQTSDVRLYIEKEISSIGELELTGNFKNTLPSQITNQNLNQFVKTPEQSNGVAFKLFLDETYGRNDEDGEITVFISGTALGVTHSNHFDFHFLIDDFKEEQKADTIKDAIKKLPPLELIGNFKNTLPSQITNQNLNQFVKTPPTSNGVTFSLSLINSNWEWLEFLPEDIRDNFSANDAEGELLVAISGTYQGYTLRPIIVPDSSVNFQDIFLRDSTVQPIKGFKISDNSSKILSALNKITTLNKTGDFTSTLVTEITNENLNQFVITPEPIDGVEFTLNLIRRDEEFGELHIYITGTYQGDKHVTSFWKGRFNPKIIKVSGFQIDETIITIKEALRKIPRFLTLLSDLNLVIASTVTNQNLNQFVKTPEPINGVSFTLRIYERDDDSLEIVVIGTYQDLRWFNTNIHSSGGNPIRELEFKDID
ncbi:lipoprotein 17-related variable surface protein [[Mycoplasma] mobile]|nr:lipoprotein 17-related variable surface protein [[Mycoplasma] mobile]